MTSARALSLLTLLAAAPLTAQSIRYTPGEFTYGVRTVVKQTQEMGGQQQASTITADQKLTVLLIARGADSLRFRNTLVSDTISADLPIKLPDVGKLQGTVIEGFMTAWGRVAHFTHRSPGGDAAAASEQAENMSHFFIALAPQTESGYSHTDTTTNRRAVEGGEIAERTITMTVVDGDTVVGGVKAWRIRRRTDVRMSGTMVQSGQDLPVTSEGTGTGTFLLSVNGVYLGSRSVTTSVTRIQLPDGSTVTQTQDATSVTALVK